MYALRASRQNHLSPLHHFQRDIPSQDGSRLSLLTLQYRESFKVQPPPVALFERSCLRALHPATMTSDHQPRPSSPAPPAKPSC